MTLGANIVPAGHESAVLVTQSGIFTKRLLDELAEPQVGVGELETDDSDDSEDRTAKAQGPDDEVQEA